MTIPFLSANAAKSSMGYLETCRLVLLQRYGI